MYEKIYNFWHSCYRIYWHFYYPCWRSHRTKAGGGYVGIVTVSGVVSALLCLWPVLVSVFHSLAGRRFVGIVGCLAGIVGFVGRLVGCLSGYGIYKILKKNHHHINNKGYSLIEILVTLGILSIISGIAYVSYQGYTISVNKKDLKLHGELFQNAIKNCITVRGGWNITPLINGVPDTNVSPKTPCRPEGATQDEIKNSLKNKLDFTCPAGVDKCLTHTNNTENYTCLDLRKRVLGKNLQVVSRVDVNSPSKYQVLCGEVSSYTDVDSSACKNDIGSLRNKGFVNIDGNNIKSCPW